MCPKMKIKSFGYVCVKGCDFEYSQIRTKEDGEIEYYLNDSEEWATYEGIEAIMDELLEEEERFWKERDEWWRNSTRRKKRKT